MFRSFFTQHIAVEVDKELKSLRYGIQLVTDEADLLFLTKSILEITKKQIQIELVIVSNTEDKSLKITNSMKRLVDSGVDIYWYNMTNVKENFNLFAIIDKSYFISTDSSNSHDSKEFLVRSKVDEFNQIKKIAHPVKLYTGNIIVNYTVDKTIVHPHENALLTWSVENAHTVTIVPDLGEVPLKGSKLVTIGKSIKYQLTAKNSNSEIQRTIFIKVITLSVINYIVEVFDPILKDFIKLESMNTEILKFGVYSNQKIRIIWETETEGNLKEQSLGTLPSNGTYEFIAKENTYLSFEFTSRAEKISTIIHFVTFEDISKVHPEKETKVTHNKQGKTKRSFLKVCHNFITQKR